MLRVLDLFCCAGGAGMGLHRAGFEVVGVDIAPQKNYPFEFRQADALTFPLDGFDFIWASPPCQFATDLRHMYNAKQHHNFIPATRERLLKSGLPYIIENVEKARKHLRDPFLLCGSMFGLSAQGHQLRRHRLFEANWPVGPTPRCTHTQPVVGVYGGHARNRSSKHGGRKTKDEWIGGHAAACNEAMGIDWMTLDEISEAIPPAYSEFIGRAAIAHLQSRKAA